MARDRAPGLQLLDRVLRQLALVAHAPIHAERLEVPNGFRQSDLLRDLIVPASNLNGGSLKVE